MRRAPRRLILLALLAALAAGATDCGSGPRADSRRACAYAGDSIAGLREFGRLVHRRPECALIYDDAAPTWAAWQSPWFLHHPDPDRNWARWATAPGGDRRLVITQSLLPDEAARPGWRAAGAAGDYEAHARVLARNLVRAGLGDAIIRLAHEANGTWYRDSVGDTPREWSLWRRFWRRTVLAMHSVPGAHFRFDWCVNAGPRPIPVARFYPGDDVVDIVGVDAYDAGVPAGPGRWPAIYTRTDGLRDLARFAAAHGKPLSIPEWGVGPAGRDGAGGDDPAYVDGIARVVRTQRVAYQSYFYRYGLAIELEHGPRSLAAYIRHFGGGGDSVQDASG